MIQLITDRRLVESKIATFKNRPATVWVDECRWVWAPQDAWADALVMPNNLRISLFAGLHARARLLSKDRGEVFELPDEKNKMWLRWAVIQDALLAWFYRAEERKRRADRLSDDEEFLYGNVRAIRAWGDKLQEEALAGALSMSTITPAHTPALEQAIVMLANLTQGTKLELENHNTRLSAIETVVYRSPDEFVDAKSFISERGMATDLVVPGTRQTLQQWLGNKMVAENAERGESRNTRIEGTSRIATVNTYRRRDLESMIKRVPHN